MTQCFTNVLRINGSQTIRPGAKTHDVLTPCETREALGTGRVRTSGLSALMIDGLLLYAFRAIDAMTPVILWKIDDAGGTIVDSGDPYNPSNPCT